MRDEYLEKYVSSDLRNDGEKVFDSQRKLASAILVRTLQDVEIVAKGEKRYYIPQRDRYLIDDSLRFIESSLCVLCCEVVGLDYNTFVSKCLNVFATQKEGGKPFKISELASL